MTRQTDDDTGLLSAGILKGSGSGRWVRWSGCGAIRHSDLGTISMRLLNSRLVGNPDITRSQSPHMHRYDRIENLELQARGLGARQKIIQRKYERDWC